MHGHWLLGRLPEGGKREGGGLAGDISWRAITARYGVVMFGRKAAH